MPDSVTQVTAEAAAPSLSLGRFAGAGISLVAAGPAEEQGPMPVYQLGNDDDYFSFYNQPDWASNSAVFGGNGNDTITTDGLFYAPADNLFIDGGNGDDTIQLSGSNSVAFGGNGDDTLTGGLGSTLIGGNGDDTLISLGGGSGMQPGSTLTGGLGSDTFTLVNDGNLVVLNDAAGDGVVSDGDTFKGPMDAITDLGRGDHIGFRYYDVDTNGPTASDAPLAKVDSSVALVPELYTYNYNVPPISLFRPAIGSAEYAVFHGTFAGGNTFTVGADGPDLFVVYDTRTGPDELVGKGSLVLQGVTDERLLDQALSPATAQGSGGWGYSQGGDSGGQAAAMSAILDPNDSTAAMGVIPT